MALLYVGWDPLYGFQLYQSDPSGNYSGWKATCIGSNHSSATSLLKQDYKDDLSLEDAKSLCLKTMSKTMDSTKLGSEKRMFERFTCRTLADDQWNSPPCLYTRKRNNHWPRFTKPQN